MTVIDYGPFHLFPFLFYLLRYPRFRELRNRKLSDAPPSSPKSGILYPAKRTTNCPIC